MPSFDFPWTNRPFARASVPRLQPYESTSESWCFDRPSESSRRPAGHPPRLSLPTSCTSALAHPWHTRRPMIRRRASSWRSRAWLTSCRPSGCCTLAFRRNDRRRRKMAARAEEVARPGCASLGLDWVVVEVCLYLCCSTLRSNHQ